VEEAAALCRGLADSPTPRRLRHLADRLEGALSSAAAAALVHALRKAAKSPPPRPRRATGPQAAISPGDVLHGYRVTEVLPPSNFSVVCMAVRVDTHRRVVLKVPTPSTWEQPEARELFLREGHLLQVLPAEHVVRVEELFEDGPPMLVIQHLRGRTLDQHMGMDRAWLLRRCLDVLRGLRLVHDADIVHRDLKPSNVMIVPSGRAVLIDFGVAYVPPEIVGAPLGGLELMLGTPPYMAPEQWKGYRPVPATDIYALGAMTYEILAGRTPFTCASYAAYRDAHLEAEPPPLGAAAPSLLADTVLRMLAKDPEDRPPHAEVREAIEDALAQGVLVPPGGA
jgi:serine/threonine-protein kinase